MVLGNPFYVSNHIAEEEEASCFTYPFMPNVFFPTLSIGRVHIQFLGCWLIVFDFYSYFKRTFCKQTVANLIRRRVLRHLIWFCNVNRCPIKRTLGLYGLNCFVALCLMRVLSRFNMVACLCHFVILFFPFRLALCCGAKTK